ncbi:MAG: hypothetical protein CEE42_09190 [Promethearchaeota archaeon Loki_b31]|nr:MAG: hypothetical protein CEE42_09190 [Candidatus Lokiarchaeota archaeon Loki_b31]
MSVKYKGKEYKVQLKKSSLIDSTELFKTLNITHQGISNINDIIGLENLLDLQVLNLVGNKITETKGLESFSNLKVLKLNGNNITEIKGLENLFNLQELYLYYNKITEIKGLDNLSNLQELYLTYNNITEIKGLDNLSNLQELYLSHNNITEIKGLDNLSNLQELYLSYNKIAEIKGLITLSNLQILDLSYNKIDEIRGMSNLNKLTQLRLLGNPIFKWAIKHFKIKSNGEVENIPELVKYCQRDEKEKDEVVQYKKDQQLKYDQTIQYIKNLPSIYYEIDFEELKTKTKMEINELKNIIEELILNKQIEAKIRGSTIFFAKSSSSIGKVKKRKEIIPQLLEKDEYNDARALNEGYGTEVKFFKVFLSYSTLEIFFQIKNIAKILNSYPEIKETLFWEANSGENIVEYMEKTLKKCNIFVLFCSKNSLNSKAVTDEWQAAFQLRKKGSLKIIPVYEDERFVPALLTPLLNVRFLEGDFVNFILSLRKEILRE